MSKYTCYVCREEKHIEGELLTKLHENEVLLCPNCAEVVERLTGAEGREIEVDG